MSSTLLLCSASLREQDKSMPNEDYPKEIIYHYFFEDNEDYDNISDWTSKFPKGYPYTSLEEGQTFELCGEYYYVTTVKEKIVENKLISRNVWFCLNN